jgi:nucleotide-binding universal stress UspA family protein
VLKNILVPLDGSTLAEDALPYACALSIPTAARLTLLQVVHASALSVSSQATRQRDAIEAVERYVAGHATDLRQRGFEIATVTPFGGNAWEWIVEEAASRDADLVVMATHGRTGPGHWILGSVAEAVLARCPVPVLLVRAWQQPKTMLLLQDQPRVLVPLDGSEFAETVLPAAVALADDLGAALVLTRIEPIPHENLRGEDGRVLAYIDQQEENLRGAAQSYLEQVTMRLRAQQWDLKIETHVRLDEPSAGIAAAAEAVDAALVMMATHGRTGVQRARLGSVAGQTLRAGTIPLVLVGPQASRSKATEATVAPA